MPRSLKKGPFVDAHLQKKVDAQNEANTKNVNRALFEGDDGALGVVTLAPAGAGAHALALTVLGIDGSNLYLKDFFDSRLDFDLVCVGSHHEGVLTVVNQVVGFFADDGLNNHVVRVLSLFQAHLSSPFPRKESNAVAENTTSSLANTS